MCFRSNSQSYAADAQTCPTLILREKEQLGGGSHFPSISHFTSHIWQHEHLVGGGDKRGGPNTQNVTGMTPDCITKVLEQFKSVEMIWSPRISIAEELELSTEVGEEQIYLVKPGYKSGDSATRRHSGLAKMT